MKPGSTQRDTPGNFSEKDTRTVSEGMKVFQASSREPRAEVGRRVKEQAPQIKQGVETNRFTRAHRAADHASTTFVDSSWDMTSSGRGRVSNTRGNNPVKYATTYVKSLFKK